MSQFIVETNNNSSEIIAFLNHADGKKGVLLRRRVLCHDEAFVKCRTSLTDPIWDDAGSLWKRRKRVLIRRRQEIFVVSRCQRLWCGSCTRPLGIPLHDVASRYHRVQVGHVSGSATWKNGHFWDGLPPFHRPLVVLPAARPSVRPTCPGIINYCR